MPLLDGEGFSASAGEIAAPAVALQRTAGDIDAGVGFPLQEYTEHRSCRPENRGGMPFWISDMIALQVGLGAVNEITVFLAAKRRGAIRYCAVLRRGSKAFRR